MIMKPMMGFWISERKSSHVLIAPKFDVGVVLITVGVQRSSWEWTWVLINQKQDLPINPNTHFSPSTFDPPL
jgi:hypothetical protein